MMMIDDDDDEVSRGRWNKKESNSGSEE